MDGKDNNKQFDGLHYLSDLDAKEKRRRSRLVLTPTARAALSMMLKNLSRDDLWFVYFSVKGILS